MDLGMDIARLCGKPGKPLLPVCALWHCSERSRQSQTTLDQRGPAEKGFTQFDAQPVSRIKEKRAVFGCARRSRIVVRPTLKSSS